MVSFLEQNVLFSSGRFSNGPAIGIAIVLTIWKLVIQNDCHFSQSSNCLAVQFSNGIKNQTICNWTSLDHMNTGHVHYLYPYYYLYPNKVAPLTLFTYFTGHKMAVWSQPTTTTTTCGIFCSKIFNWILTSWCVFLTFTCLNFKSWLIKPFEFQTKCSGIQMIVFQYFEYRSGLQMVEH